ncbi:MAG: hypothetical protein R2867_39770 [Caldilineaceae bacterium]
MLYFSMTAIPLFQVDGPFDDADIYAWDGTNFSRIFDASVAGLPNSADIDALYVVNSETFYLSFSGNMRMAFGDEGEVGSIQDEDVVLYQAGIWTIFFNGTDAGLNSGNSEDVDSFGLLSDGSFVISTAGNPNLPGLSGLADEDLMRCVPQNSDPISTCNWSLYVDGSDVGLTDGSEDINGASVSSAGNIYMTTVGNFGVAGLSGNRSDVFICNEPTTGSTTSCTSFAMFFDGNANGISDNLDAISVPGLGDPPIEPPAPLVFDNFNVANGSLSANWAGATDQNSFRIRSQQVQSRPNSGAIWYNAATLGPNQEAFMTFTNVRNSNRSNTRWQGLLLKLNGGDPDSTNASAIDVRYASNVGVAVRTKAAGEGWILQAEFSGVSFGRDDQLSAQALADGTVNVYKNGELVGSVNVLTGPHPWPVANAQAGGYIGVSYNFSNGRFDDFGGNDLDIAAAAEAASQTALGQIAEIDVKDTELDESDPFDFDLNVFIPLVNN